MEKLSKEQYEAVVECNERRLSVMGFKQMLKEKGLVKDEFKIGRLYYLGGMVCVFTGNKSGVDITRDNSEIIMCTRSKWTELNDDESLEVLSKEAIKRGYKKGVRVKYLNPEGFIGNSKCSEWIINKEL